MHDFLSVRYQQYVFFSCFILAEVDKENYRNLGHVFKPFVI